MNTSESNPTRNEQKEQIKKSPMQTPATETVHADVADAGKAASDDGAALGKGTPGKGAAADTKKEK